MHSMIAMNAMIAGCIRNARRLTLTTAALTALGVSAAAHADIDIDLLPATTQVGVGEIVEVQVIVSADGAGDEEFDAIDVLFTWDPMKLDLIGFDDAGVTTSYAASGFLPNPDGINLDLDDGDAIYTALIVPIAPGMAPPGPKTLLITTLRFQALMVTPSTDIELVPSMGLFSQTRVLRLVMDVTGEIGGPANVEILLCPSVACPGDIIMDGAINVFDLLQMLALWGTDDCLADIAFDGGEGPDGIVNLFDLLELLSRWGACP